LQRIEQAFPTARAFEVFVMPRLEDLSFSCEIVAYAAWSALLRAKRNNWLGNLKQLHVTG
jgi:hypothetical protein